MYTILLPILRGMISLFVSNPCCDQVQDPNEQQRGAVLPPGGGPDVLRPGKHGDTSWARSLVLYVQEVLTHLYSKLQDFLKIQGVPKKT